MNAASVIRDSRRRAGLTLRALADRAGTSHATLAAYESGRVIPRVDTLDRIVNAAGFGLDATLQRRATDGLYGPGRKGDELRDALELAAAFPSTPAPTLRFPVLRRRR